MLNESESVQFKNKHEYVNKNDTKTGTLTKGFFYQEENNDYELVFPDQEDELKQKQEKNSQAEQTENFDYQRKKRYKPVNLKPYDVEDSRMVLEVGRNMEEKNPEKNENERRKKKEKRRKDIFFQPEEVEMKKEEIQQKKEEERQIQKEEQDIEIVRNEKSDISEKSDKEDKSDRQNKEEEIVKSEEQQSEKGSENDKEENELTNTHKLIKVHSPIPPQSSSTFVMKRDNNWKNKIHPQFHLHFLDNKEHFISAKQTSNNATSTYIISHDKNDFRQNGCNYVGKVKSNFIGNIINIFGPGYNPEDVKEKQLNPRQLLATVVYETNFFGIPKPRDFCVYTLKPQVSYTNNLYGVKLGHEEIPLNELYKNKDNRENISLFYSRKAQWNDSIGAHVLNFSGRVKKASVKNFILEDKNENNKESLVFGKLQDEYYIMDITSEITPFVAFGIALSTFGSKIGCE